MKKKQKNKNKKNAKVKKCQGKKKEIGHPGGVQTLTARGLKKQKKTVTKTGVWVEGAKPPPDPVGRVVIVVVVVVVVVWW